jgi:predicted TIM-barrel fold metal-dependent hydrolase
VSVNTAKPVQIVDPHLHLWQLSAGHYHWLRPENAPYWQDKALLQQDFSAEALELAPHFQLAGLVHIEAGFDNTAPERELAWLAQQPMVCAHRAVAFLDCSQELAQVQSNLQRVLAYKPAGVRHIFEGDDERWLHAPQLEHIASMLAQHQLILEVQCQLATEKNVLRIAQLAQQFPGLALVINHAGLVQPEHFQAWQQASQILAAFPNIALKLSGFEMRHAGRYSPPDNSWQQQVFAAVLNHWQPSQLMLASNFPLCLWQGSYQQLWQRYYQLLTGLGLNAAGWQQLRADTARQWYGLDVLS